MSCAAMWELMKEKEEKSKHPEVLHLKVPDRFPYKTLRKFVAWYDEEQHLEWCKRFYGNKGYE